ncbi:hypothetical protein PWR66_04200 [Paraburkholderia sp. A1RO-5]
MYLLSTRLIAGNSQYRATFSAALPQEARWIKRRSLMRHCYKRLHLRGLFEVDMAMQPSRATAPVGELIRWECIGEQHDRVGHRVGARGFAT